MRLTRRPEVLFHSDVQLHRAHREPASSSSREQRRLLNLLQLEQTDKESPRVRLTPRGRGDLDVIDPAYGHPASSRWILLVCFWRPGGSMIPVAIAPPGASTSPL